MTLTAGDYGLFATKCCRQAYVTARDNLARRGLLDLFDLGLNTLVGRLSQGMVGFPGARKLAPNLVAATIQNVFVHLKVDARRKEIRIIRLLDRSPPL